MHSIRIKHWVIAGAILLTILVWTRSQAQSQQPKTIRYGDTVTGTIKAGEVDSWAFTGTAGEVIALDVERSSSTLEPMLTLNDSADRPIVGTQAAAGQSSASLMQVRLVQSGIYTIQVGGNNKTEGDYKLTLTLTTSAPPTPTSAPTPFPHTLAGTITPGTTVHGQITTDIHRQFWQFTGNSGDIVDILMRATSGNLDSFLTLQSPAQDVIAVNDSASGGPDAAILAFQLPFSGTYTLIARRAGENQGEGGTTTGGYDLTVVVRTNTNPTQNTTLNFGVPLFGRVTTELPTAVYRLELGGAVAFNLDLIGLHRLAALRVLSSTGTVLATYQGLSPLAASITLPENGPFLIEASATSYDDKPDTDFSITAYHLSANFSDALPLRYGIRRHASITATVDSNRWFFVAHSGDMVHLTLTPETAALKAGITIFGPNDTPLYLGTLGPGMDQVLTLPDDGAYEIEVHDSDETVSYDAVLQRIGARNKPFDQFGLAANSGPLSLAAPTAGSLKPGATDAWLLDAKAGQAINLTGFPKTNNAIIGLAIQRPDGSFLDTATSDHPGGATIQQAVMPVAGRYRVLVFDLTGTGAQYSLTYEDTSGGDIQTQQSVKGVISPTNGFATWLVDVPNGSLINAALIKLTPKSWTPSLLIADPGGFIVGSSTFAEGAMQGNLLGVSTPVAGQYRVIVAGQVITAFASYQLTTNIQAPFGSNPTSPIQVNAAPTGLERYAPLPTSQPVQINIPSLINPLISSQQVTASNPQPIGLDTTVRGEIVHGDLFQAWQFNVGADVAFTLRATSLSGDGGPSLSLMDQGGKIVGEQAQASNQTTALTYHSVQGGTYFVIVRMGFNGGRYLLSLEHSSVVKDGLQISDGTPIVYGQTIPGELLDGDTSDVYYFYGFAGDIVSVQVKADAGNLTPGLQLIGTDGKVLAEDKNGKNGITAALTKVYLPQRGVYRIAAGHSASGSNTSGRYFLTLGATSGSRVRGRNGGLITPGQTETGLLSPDNTTNTWLFHGHSGDYVTFVASSVGDPLVAPLGLALEDTAGNIFAMQNIAATQGVIRIADIILPGDGIYRAEVTGGVQTSGTYTITWQQTNQPGFGSLAYGHTAGGIFTADHNIDTWVFTGTTGDVISVALHDERGDHFTGGFQVLSESGVALATAADPGDGTGARVDNLLLPFSGSYRILAANPDPNFKGTGVYSLNVTLQDSKARSMGGQLALGQQAMGDLYTDDQSDSWTFTARGGQMLQMSVLARDHFLKPTLELHGALGAVLLSTNADEHGLATLNNYPVPSDGVYVITITGGPDKTTGSYLLSLNDITPTISDAQKMSYDNPNKSDSKKGLIANDRFAETWQFQGREGDTISIKMTRASGSNLIAVVELWDQKQNILLARHDANGDDSAEIDNYVLPYSAQFTIIATRYRGEQGQSTGNYVLSLSGTSQTVQTKGVLQLGLKAIGRLSDDEPVDRWTFQGQKNSVVGITSKATSGDLDTVLTVEDKDGNVLATNDDADGINAVIDGVFLPDDGTYTVILSRVGTKTVGTVGNYDLQADLVYQYNATATPKALITYGQRVVSSVDVQNPTVRYTFSGLKDDQINVQLIHQTDDAPPLLSITDPSGTTLAQGKLSVGQTTITGYQLPVTGLYTIVVSRPINTQLNYSPFALTLSLLTVRPDSQAGTTGGVLISGNSVTRTFSANQPAQYWLFEGKTNMTITIDLVRLSGDVRLSGLLIGPNSQGLGSMTVPQYISSATIDNLSLPSDGVYSLLVLGNGTGQYRLTFSGSGTFAAPTAITTGQTVSGTLDAVHSVQRWSFSGQKGQTISARMLATDGVLLPYLKLLNPDGSALGEGYFDRTQQGSISNILNFTLPDTGNYILEAGSNNQTAGNYRLSVEIGALSAEAVAAQPIVYGQTVRNVVQQGTTDLWTFNGAAGDTVSIAVLASTTVSNPTTSSSTSATAAATQGSAATPTNTPTPTADSTSPAPTLELHDASGRVLANGASASANETDVFAYTLPVTGRYVIALPAQNTTSYTMVIQRRQSLLVPGAGGRALVPDQALDNGISPDGSVDFWFFKGKAGNVIQIQGTQVNGNIRIDMALYGPSGFLTSAVALPNEISALLGPVQLPEDGTYQLVVTRWLIGHTSGRYRLVMSSPTNATPLPTSTPFVTLVPTQAATQASAGQQLAFGQPQHSELTKDAPSQTWVFSGKAGERITASASADNASFAPALSLSGPDGTPLASRNGSNGSAQLTSLLLAQDGLYSLTITHNATDTNVGGFTLTVQHDQPGAMYQGTLAVGENVSGTLNPAQPTEEWLFEVTDSTAPTIAATITSASAGFNGTVSIASEDGHPLATSDPAQQGSASVQVALPGPGRYAVVVSSTLQAAYNLTLSYALSPTGGGLMVLNQSVLGTVTDTDFSDQWRINLKAGAKITIDVKRLDTSSDLNPSVFVYAPDGTLLTSKEEKTAGEVSLSEVSIPSDGTYTIIVSRAGGGTGQSTGTYGLKVSG